MKYFCRYLSTCLIVVLASVTNADPIEPANVMVLTHSQSSSAHSLSDSDFTDKMKLNLINQINQTVNFNETARFFGKPAKWQSLDKVDPETVDGLHIFKLELSTDRFTKGRLKIVGLKKASLFLNGLHTKGSDNLFKLQLINADHRLYVVTDTVEDWQKVSFEWSSDGEEDAVTFHSNSPKQRLHAKQMYDSATYSNLSISPDGDHMVWTKRHYSEATGDKAISQTELLDVSSQKVVYRWQGLTPSALSWSPDNKSLLYTTGGSVFLLDRDSFELTPITEDVSGASNFIWSSNNTVVFSWLKRDESNKAKTKRYRALEDRWSYWRNNTQVYVLDIESGLIVQVTKDELSHTLQDVSSDATKALVTRTPVDYNQPPHFRVELVEVDIQSGKESILATARGSINRALYAEDGVYVLAGPSFGGGVGKAVSKDVDVNDYDGQLYIIEDNGRVKPLSKSFNPAISSLSALSNNDLLVTATDQDRRKLFHYDASRGEFKTVNSPIDVIDGASASLENRPTVLFAGTNATLPQRVFLKGGNKKAKLLVDTASSDYANTEFSVIRDWDFTNDQGEVIDGRYYLPPDFDSTKKYPVIVYYYGGTSPVTRAFTGRWPFSLWAAHGYIVYVHQPAGTFGYGQDFSAKHVNAWGLQTADDIIASTQAFLEAHPFADASKVANMGASYGGFMTMYLATKTDLFAASISHAGISNLSEYWGYGWWGFAYSGVATRGLFPWNATDFYTEQSPLFQADDVTTPLLLIHGSGDTNVPTSQSHQMYTALKILDKDVEFVEFMGEDHHINTRKRRLEWWSTIMSYLDYKLKDQPLWWQTLYPE